MTDREFFALVVYVFAGIYGLCIGSFLNVVIYRTPLGMSVAKPSSHCPTCQNPIAWYDNIPVLSYLLLGGKCRHCKTHISFRYTIVEITNALLWLLGAFLFLPKGLPYVLIAAAASSLLLCVFFIDLEHKIILDRFQIMLGVLAVLVTVLDTLRDQTAWIPHLIGGIVGYGVLWLIGFCGEKILKREALGGGDVKLCGVMGLFLGWKLFLLSILVASVAACVVLLSLRFVRKDEEKEYPFAPFLACGFALAMFFGDTILSWYLSLLI